MAYDVQITTTAQRHYAVTRFHASREEIGEKLGEAFQTVEAFLTANHIQVTGAAMAQYVMQDGGFSVSAGFAVTGAIAGDGTVVAMELPQMQVAMATHLGSYDTLPQAYEAMSQYARSQGRELDEAAPMWEEYWSTPDTPPEETRTDIYWPLR